MDFLAFLLDFKALVKCGGNKLMLVDARPSKQRMIRGSFINDMTLSGCSSTTISSRLVKPRVKETLPLEESVLP